MFDVSTVEIRRNNNRRSPDPVNQRSPDPVKESNRQRVKDFSVMYSVSIEKDTRFVIWFKEDDSGVLYPQIRVETLGHTEGLRVGMVSKKDCVIVTALAARFNSSGLP